MHAHTHTHTLHILPQSCCYLNGYDFNAYNNVRDILDNTDVITSIVKLIVHSPVGNLLIYDILLGFFFFGGGGGGLILPCCEQT